MFDLTVNDTSAIENSDAVNNYTREDMSSLKHNIIDCPALLTGMSHEMRTHMNAIVAFSYLMKEKSGDNLENEELSNHILSSCEQLIGLFGSFLDSAIIDTGISNSYLKICKLDNIFDDLLLEFRETIQKEGLKEVELISEIQLSDSEEVFIDTNRVFRVIRSLLQNSIKNTKSGYIKVGYSFRDSRVTFHVIDSGQGYLKCKEFLHTEDLNESLTKHNDTHSAINITLAKKIIQMLGGTIWIECNGLSGAGIYFTVPVRMMAKSDINNNRCINSTIAI